MSSFTQSLCTKLEPVFRRVVHEEIQKQLDRYANAGSLQRLRIGEAGPSADLQLVVTEQMPAQIYTKRKIRNKDNKPLQVKLINTISQEIVDPSSPTKVEIVVLNGDFPSRHREDWTSEEFNSNLVKERNGKAPLLVGERIAVLVGGVASFQGLEFTDNSCWSRSGKFILGVRVHPSSYDGPRIKEGVTKPFKVLDRRGESYKKHFPPRPNDEVWRLRKIAKGGAFHKKLEKAKIQTVKDFLTQLNLDPRHLRKILGKGMSEELWKATTKHAKTCKDGEERYLHQGQPSTINYPQQVDNELNEVNVISTSGYFGMQQVNSMPIQGGTTGTWPPSYQQQNMIMPTYQQGTGTSLNNMQTNSNIMIEDMEFEVCSPDQRGYPS
ncbi:calmodulin-binding protein 60 D-like isoform X1 [Canna indica]|uniref:Calmodulin-binding protein 60 D-like isoform X1 n=1 Tax=Canna indica TaxID=4628 RepID=A0AAQ3JMS2_9LILI|nr:calmodulin-binding protein 60 D-like isoform X1 [Canna indica]